ncbi:hypothetical protein Dimus_030260 [Dionaea muscipula]
MAEERRWPVTYTKHVKQKRKTYHDGYLLIFNNKVMLYDDTEKLLDSKFLKKDEALKHGETIAFSLYLVDIGDVEAVHKPLSTLNSDSNATEKVGQHKNSKSNFLPPDRMCTHRRKKISAANISPSQKIIREFQKNEMLKYGTQQSPPGSNSPMIKEWQVLYTTQLTQKAKKYHDGILQLLTCGSQGRQVKLYDAQKNLLESRFLKKDEVIKTSETLRLDAHLVDIEDPEVSHEHLVDLNAQGSNLVVTRRAGTTERHWSKDSSIVGTKLPNLAGSRLSQDHFLSNKSVPTGEFQELDAYSRMEEGSTLRSLVVEKVKLQKNLPASKRIRDACDILSILRKSVAPVSILSTKEAHAVQCLPHCSELVVLDIDKDQILGRHVHDSEHQSSCTNQHSNEEALKEKFVGRSSFNVNILESKVDQSDFSCKVKQKKVCDDGEAVLLGTSTPVDVPFGFTSASAFLMVKNADSRNSVIDRSISSKRFKMLDTAASCTPGWTPPTTRTVPRVGMHSSLDLGESLKSVYSKGKKDKLPCTSVGIVGCYQLISEDSEAGICSGEKETTSTLEISGGLEGCASDTVGNPGRNSTPES